jgi:hypothetical protein
MNFTKTMFALAIGSVGIMGAMSAHAATLNNGDQLTITNGPLMDDVIWNDVPITGSWYAFDNNGNSTISAGEKVTLQQGTTGIVIGASNTAAGEITAPWSFMAAPGYDWVSTPITGGTSGLDMSGWMVAWNGSQSDRGTGAWQVNASGMPTSGYTNGIGIFNWSGVYGDSYTLDYAATPQYGPFTGYQWALHLEGTVQAVPEASTYGMLLAGLGLVGIATMGRKQSNA